MCVHFLLVSTSGSSKGRVGPAKHQNFAGEKCMHFSLAALELFRSKSSWRKFGGSLFLHHPANSPAARPARRPMLSQRPNLILPHAPTSSAPAFQISYRNTSISSSFSKESWTIFLKNRRKGTDQMQHAPHSRGIHHRRTIPHHP